MRRLDRQPDEWLDRSRILHFTFEGRPYTGWAGDTVSSALLAAGVGVLARSFKLHRPRGVLGLADIDANVLLQTPDAPNQRGDVLPLVDGGRYVAVNTRGGVARDRARWLDALSRLLPVGFYYKAFHRPAWLFPFWERRIRAVAGLGVVDPAWPRRISPERHLHCDVLVVGAGASGLSAALAAAQAGAEVVLVERDPAPGGDGLHATYGDAPRRFALQRLIAEVVAHPRVRLLCGALAAGCYADRLVPVVEPQRLSLVRARALVVASGVAEQPAVFRNNDLPGVMLASAAQRLVTRYAVCPGHRAVVLAANAQAYLAAAMLHDAGVGIAAIVDLRGEADIGHERALAEARALTIRAGHAVICADARAQRVAAVRIAALDAGGRPQPGRGERLACDLLLMGVGWAPMAQLLAQCGAGFAFDEALQQHVPETLPSGVQACGRVNGVFDLDARLADGRRAGLCAAADAGHHGACPEPVARDTRAQSHAYPIFAHRRGRNFVDFDEDLQLHDLEDAIAEGFDSVELLKRYSTLGMGPSQGKHSNMNAIRVLARALGVSPGAVGTTTARPFVQPVPMQLLAGRGLRAERRTALDSRHVQLGAVWMPAGEWRRVAYYARPGEPHETTVAAEVRAVRNALGLIDVGTLGKIELRGRDAPTLLERAYTGRFAQLAVGRTRYALMLDESGVIVDDGVVARLAEDHFYVTTTSAMSARVYRELQRWAQIWRLDVVLSNLTGHMAAINLAGPRARSVLASLSDIDLSPEAFPHLAVRRGHVACMPCRVLRVGFVGELGYEIHVPSDGAGRVWDLLMRAGQPAGVRAFGVDAQRVLRLEKGHLIVGQDSDGLTTPLEAGCAWALGRDKAFFVGQRSLAALQRQPPRHRLVGFVLAEPAPQRLPQESQLVIHDGEIAGRITSIARSPTLARVIGLAMVSPALAAPGSRLTIRGDDGPVAAEVVPTPFYDPHHRRQQPPEAGER